MLQSFFNAQELLGLSLKYKEFITLYDITHLDGISDKTVIEFKSYFPSMIQPIYGSLNDIPVPVINITWIEITFLNDTALNDVEPTKIITSIPPSSIRGIRKGQAAILSKNFLSVLIPSQGTYILYDTTSVFSYEQIGALQPTTFANLPNTSVEALSISAITGITPDQIPYLNPQIFNILSCEQITNFTEAQKNNMTTAQKNIYNQRYHVCTLPPVTPVPTPPPSPTPPPGTPSSPSNTNPGFWTLNAIIGVSAGGGAVFIILGIVVYCCYCRRKPQTQIEYAPINS